MKKHIQFFTKIISAYNIEEKVISLILVVITFFLIGQTIVDLFKGGIELVKAQGSYTEGLVSSSGIVINPLYSDFSEANREINQLVFSGLVKYNPDTREFIPDIAENITISKDKKTYSFTIKDNIHWQDNKKLTIDDVYFTYHDLIQQEGFQNPILKENFAGVKINVINDKIIEFTLNKPNSFFISNFNTGILPKHILKDTPIEELLYSKFNNHPIGTGPYKVKEITKDNNGGEIVSLEVNKNYYNSPAKIDIIKFHIYKTEENLYKDKDTLNIISKVPFSYIDAFKQDKRFSYTTYQLPQYTAIFINMNSPILKKDKVRQALKLSINKDGLIKQLKWKTKYNLTDLIKTTNTNEKQKKDKDKDKKENTTTKKDKEKQDKPISPIEQAKGALYDEGFKLNKEETYRKDKKGNILELNLLIRKFNDEETNNEMNKVAKYLKTSWGNL